MLPEKLFPGFGTPAFDAQHREMSGAVYYIKTNRGKAADLKERWFIW